MNENLCEARADFHSFIEAFEKRDYDKMEKTARVCKNFVSDALKEKAYSEEEYADCILDIVSFAYDQMYWYQEKADVLKILIHSRCLSTCHQKRALENLLAPTDIPFKDAEHYELMLQELLNKEEIK